MFTGRLSPSRAARLAANLPPGSAIFRGTDIDSRLLTDAERSLRLLINMQAEEPMPFPSELAERQQKALQVRARAEARFAQMRRADG